LASLNTDLHKLSLKDLRALKEKVEKAIAEAEKRAKKEAREKLEAQARALGFSLSELVEVPKRKSRRRAAAKYANPDNPSQTWSGHGRRPRWVEEALKSGKSLDDLAI